MRIAPRNLRRYSPGMRLLFASQRRKYGAVLDPTLLWARLPRLYVPFLLLFSGLSRRHSPISAQVRTLVSVRISQINWCPFCVDLNTKLWTDAGGSSEKVSAVANWKASSDFSPVERVALSYAEAVTRTDAHVDDSLFEELKRHFDDDAVVELTALIAFQNMSSKFNAALGAAPAGLCQIPMAGRSTAAPPLKPEDDHASRGCPQPL